MKDSTDAPVTSNVSWKFDTSIVNTFLFIQMIHWIVIMSLVLYCFLFGWLVGVFSCLFVFWLGFFFFFL